MKARIEATLEKSELEDLYLPFKPKRRTKATIAREKGLEPLALYLWEQQAHGQSLAAFAESFVDAAKGVASADEALEGARHIVAEMISENADIRKALRQLMWEEGVVLSRKVEDAKDEQEKFKMYYEDYRERGEEDSFAPHAGDPARGEREHPVLPDRAGLGQGGGEYPVAGAARPGDWTPHLKLAIEDAYKRLLNSSIQAEIRLELKQRSDAEAIRVFRENLENLLLAPPAGQIGRAGDRSGDSDGMQDRGGGRDGKVSGSHGDLSACSEERPGGIGAQL